VSAGADFFAGKAVELSGNPHPLFVDFQSIFWKKI